MVQIIILHNNLNIDKHGKDKAWVSYTKLNEVGKPYLANPYYFIVIY
jgi:hypothetical protein